MNQSAPSRREFAPRVVLISTYDAGLEPWLRREQLDRRIALPAAFSDPWVGSDGSVIGLVTGMGAINAATSIMALGLDPRFDLRETYWLIAGLGGIDPEDGSLGSAVWAEWVVDGDLAFEVDARDMPPTWETGRLVLATRFPYAPLPRREGTAFRVQEVYRLDAELAIWAYELSRGVELADDPEVAAFRAGCTAFPAACRPPEILRGDVIGASTYWHGARLNTWANRWVDHWTAGRGRMVISTMEDAGRAGALQNLARAGRADFRRVLVMRVGCNFTRPAAGDVDVVTSLAGSETTGPFVAEALSLENMIRAGGPIVDALRAGETPATTDSCLVER